MSAPELSTEMTLEIAMGPLAETLRPVHKALSHVTREVRPADAAFTRTTKAIRLLQAEVGRLRIESNTNAAMAAKAEARVRELEHEAKDFQRGVDWHRNKQRENREEIERLRAENAELRESLRRIVGHLEYEVKQGDGIADDAHDDYFAAKSMLGQKGMPNAAERGLAAIRLAIASNKPGAGT